MKDFSDFERVIDECAIQMKMKEAFFVEFEKTGNITTASIFTPLALELLRQYHVWANQQP